MFRVFCQKIAVETNHDAACELTFFGPRPTFRDSHFPQVSTRAKAQDRQAALFCVGAHKCRDCHFLSIESISYCSNLKTPPSPSLSHLPVAALPKRIKRE